jgi:hypothetical protein
MLVPQVAAGQQGLITGSLTVTGFGQASAPADNATVTLTVSSESMMMAPIPASGISAEDEVEPIVDALAGAGIDEGTIDVITGPNVTAAASYFGPALAIVRFDIADPSAESIATAVEAASAAATEARLYVGGMSVRFTSDNCAALEREAREAAIADARARADVVGELAGMLPGEAIALRDVPPGPESVQSMYGPIESGCGLIETSTPGWEMYGPSLYDPTQEPIVTAYAQVEMTFATSPAILATPSG